MDFKDAFEKLQEDPGLAKSLSEAIKRNADAAELSEILAKAGIAAEDAENLVSEYQRRRGLAISDDDVDMETLRQVAGGGSGVDCVQAHDCDGNYKYSYYWDLERCEVYAICDEAFSS